MVIQHKSYPICPPWLKPLISAKFFEPCSNHSNLEASSGARIECNLFCLNCMSDPLCFSCTPSHKHHNIVQIRRSSYHDVIRVSEIQKVLDLSGVQSYIINSARVVFLNGRPQSKLAKGVTKTCEICERSLNDNFRYCSLGCKLQGINRHNDLTFMLQPKNQQQAASNSQQRAHSSEDHESQPQQQMSHRKSRSRKGSISAKLAAISTAAMDQEEDSAPKFPNDDAQESSAKNSALSAPENLSSLESLLCTPDSSEEASGIIDDGIASGLAAGLSENFQENLMEISPSTPPQVVIIVPHHEQRAAKRRKGTPHRSHLVG